MEGLEFVEERQYGIADTLLNHFVKFTVPTLVYYRLIIAIGKLVVMCISKAESTLFITS